MARRHDLSDTPSKSVKQPPAPNTKQSFNILPSSHNLTNTVSKYLNIAYNILGKNYAALVTVFMIVLLSFFIPDISQKLYATNELNSMKKVLEIMTDEVTRAEAACLTAANDICCMQCAVKDGTTETAEDLRDLSVCTSSCLQDSNSEPVEVHKKIGFFRRVFFPYRNISHKEITIMSYVYTDSFDAKKKTIVNHSGKLLRS